MKQMVCNQLYGRNDLVQLVGEMLGLTKKFTFKLDKASESPIIKVPFVTWSVIEPIVVYNDKYTCKNLRKITLLE